MPAITPFLWFKDQAEEAAAFYASIFKDVKVGGETHLGDDVPGPKGKTMTVQVELEGQEFIFLNGGPVEGFEFSPATSFVVSCENQAEIDHLWGKLTDGGKELQCGWVTDKFGVTWQIVPSILSDLLNDPDPAKAKRVTQAMLKMVKLDIATLQQARDE